MQPYSNFQAPINPQFAPMYPQAQYQNPYMMDRMAQLQAMQQNLQPQPQVMSLNGKVIDSVESITASDVPMDGTFAVFPKRDMSEICLKYWTGEGKIATISFKPVLDTQSVISPPEQENQKFDELGAVLEGLHEKVDNLSLRLDEILKTKSSSSRTKKEGEQS